MDLLERKKEKRKKKLPYAWGSTIFCRDVKLLAALCTIWIRPQIKSTAQTISLRNPTTTMVLKTGKSWTGTQPAPSKQQTNVDCFCTHLWIYLQKCQCVAFPLSLPVSLPPSLLSLFLISLEVGLPSVTKRTSIDWFQRGYWWFHNLGTETQKGWPPLRSARQPSQQGCLHLLAWERSSCRIKAHLPTHWSLSWKQYWPPSLAAS